MQGFNYKKSIQALNYFAIKSDGKLNKMKALKLIWLSDRYHLRHFGKTITGDSYFALPFGPVASTTRDILENKLLSKLESEYSSSYIKKTDKYNFMSINDVELTVFSKKDIETLDIIYSSYSDMAEFDISEFSHRFPEWKKYQHLLEKSGCSRYSIDLNDFFVNFIDEKGLFINDEEYLSYAKELYNQNASRLCS
jgi:hypothetical protein